MINPIDTVTLDLLRSIRFRLNGGSVWLEIATNVIVNDEDRCEALDAMRAQRAFLQRELNKLDAAITLCDCEWGLVTKEGAPCR